MKRYLILGGLCLALMCSCNNQSQKTDVAEEETTELKEATDPYKDGTYKAEWTCKGQWFAMEYELQNKAIRSAKFIEQDETYELQCKLAHGKTIKAIRPDMSEKDFYVQFNLEDLQGYMNYNSTSIAASGKEIEVTLYELSK